VGRSGKSNFGISLFLLITSLALSIWEINFSQCPQSALERWNTMKKEATALLNRQCGRAPFPH
jgi:hypothetical protein